MVVLIPIAVVLLLLITPRMLRGVNRYRMMSELRREWWPRFERDLGDYMSHRWRSAREAERH